jgi:hypothetical protein
MTHGKQPPISFGDLVRINGYGNRVFQVESFREEIHYWQDGIMSELVYELFDCGNADWLEADAEDLTLVADASQADEYLRANPAPMEPSSIDFSGYLFGMDIANQFGGGNEMKPNQPERKPTARELSGQEAERRKQARKDRAKKIDACLDWMNYYREQGGAAAEAKVAEIKQELAELVEAGDGR